MSAPSNDQFALRSSRDTIDNRLRSSLEWKCHRMRDTQPTESKDRIWGSNATRVCGGTVDEGSWLGTSKAGGASE